MRMAPRPVWPPIARRFLTLAAVAFGVSCPPGRAATAVEAVPDKTEKAKPKITFSPEVEAKLEKFWPKVKEAKLKLLKERMQKEIDDVAKVTGLNSDGIKALQTSSQPILDPCLEDWLGKIEETLRGALGRSPGMELRIMDQLLPDPDGYAADDAINGYVQPVDRPAWTEALKRTLTAEQAAAWQKVQTERHEAFEKEVGDYLRVVTAEASGLYASGILAMAADIKHSLGLSKERAAKLDLLARKAAGESAAAWGKRVEQSCLQMDEKLRRQLLKNRQIFLGFDSGDRPDQQKAWKDGLAALLSADELKRLDAAAEERRLRRMRGIGALMVAEFDDKAAFTSIQRQRLQPLVTRLVNEEFALFSENENESMYSVAFSPRAFLTLGAKANEREMKEILDPVQWRHWKEACGQKIPDGDSENEPEEKTAGAEARPQGVAEPEDLENAISDFLYEKTLKERDRILPVMVLKAEDAGRVAGLSADAVDRLETAARGASDKLLGDWKSSASQWVRSIVQDATPRNVRQRLRSIETYNLPRDLSVAPEKEAIWTAATKAELTSAQMAAWTKAADERGAYLHRAIALAAMEEFDRRIPLTHEQWEKLEPMIVAMVNEYAPEISAMFGYGNASRWYMQSYSLFIPFAAVPEKDMKPILEKEQWDQWAGNPEFANSKMWWGNIQQNHAMRVKIVK
jgi:hypothetical protein